LRSAVGFALDAVALLILWLFEMVWNRVFVGDTPCLQLCKWRSLRLSCGAVGMPRLCHMGLPGSALIPVFSFLVRLIPFPPLRPRQPVAFAVRAKRGQSSEAFSDHALPIAVSTEFGFTT
jgi:hypothetical protein